MIRKYTVLLLLGLFTLNVWAGKLEKGFEALRIYDYFKAKNNFEAALKKNAVAAGFGLATIYVRPDNPFHNADSAFRFIQLADTGYLKLEEKEKTKLFGLGIDSAEILAVKTQVSTLFFEQAVKGNTSQVLNQFITEHPWAIEMDTAIQLRNKRAFEEALELNSWKDYQAYFMQYPNSKFSIKARQRYDRLFYEDKVKSGTLDGYKTFIKEYPMSPYVSEAHDEIYALSTKSETVTAYHNFVKDNPNNRNVKDAWSIIYKLSITRNDAQAIQHFLAKYPDYPNRAEMALDVELLNEEFYPIQKDKKWGFMNDSAITRIAPEYDWADTFHEGLAMVGKGDYTGFIDKKGKVVVPIQYDDAGPFKNGFAWVQKDDSYGLVNNHGQLVLPVRYDDIGEMKEGLVYVQRKGKYGYFSSDLRIQVPFRYQKAAEFDKGNAIVQLNGKYGVIDELGEYILPPAYDWLAYLNDSILNVRIADKSALIKLNGDTLLEFDYEYIGELSENRILVSRAKKYGYIDVNGVVKIDLKYPFNEAVLAYSQFKNGFVKIKSTKGKYGIVDSLGKKVYPAMFENIGRYNENGLTAVKRYGKWGYANDRVKLSINYKYEFGGDFEFQQATVRVKGKQGVIDQNGNYLVPTEYESIQPLANLLLVEREGKLGLLNRNYDWVIPCAYDAINQVNDRAIQIHNNGKIAYFDYQQNFYFFVEQGFQLSEEVREIDSDVKSN